MRIFFAILLFIFSFVQSINAQNITSAELSKLSADINALQIAADGKSLIEPDKNISSVISFPKQSFSVLFSSGFAYRAVYKDDGTDQLFVTENIDFSAANKVTVLPVNNKSGVQCIRVSFPEPLVTRILENGKEINTISGNTLDFYYATSDLENKNKLKTSLETLISMLAKERTKYHTIMQGKLTLADGFYDGYYIAGNRRTNEGTMEYINEPLYKGVWIYKGQWKDDRRHGEGTLTKVPYKQGQKIPEKNIIPVEIYSGKWENDVLQGPGKYEKLGDYKYEGPFVNGKMEGMGISIDNYGSKYVGDWKNGVKEGKGTLTSGSWVYNGEWKNGELNGEGTHTRGSGGYQYSGGFRNGKEHGIGTLEEGAEKYVGEWSNGFKKGRGEFKWANGNIYNGEWNVYMQGKGIMYYANGDIYDGEWYDRKKSGEGTYNWKNGDTYTGKWSKDTMNGEGTMIYKTGERYVGEWKFGKPDGVGTFYDKDNNKIKEIGLDKPVLNTTYLRKKTEVLNKDKTYFVNYILTDSTLILYIPKNFSHKIYFDLNNDKNITSNVDLKYEYVSTGPYYRSIIKSTGYYENDYNLLPARRDSSNIFELTFRLKDILNLRRTVGIINPKEIALQICFTDGDRKVYLPKREKELDFTEGKMYYIKVKL